MHAHRGSGRLSIAALIAAVLALASPALAAWPDRPITLIVPYPAGGGTDMVARTLAALLEKDLKVPVNVVNRGGGGGVTGHEAIARATPDGYTLGMITNDLSFYKWQGLSNLTYADFMPIGQTNELPATVTVKIDAPYKSVSDLLAVIKANPGKLKGTGASPGASWHVGMLGMLASLKVDAKNVVWVPSQGGMLGHQDVAAGGSDFSTSSLAEARALIDAKKVRTLALMGEARAELFPDIPTLREATGSDWTFAVIHGVGAPLGLPKEVTDRLVPAIRTTHESKEFRSVLTQRIIQPVYRAPAEYAAYLKKDFDKMGVLLKSVGLAR
jgi:tripartite-type tricarboxylate transporter receptor subunit TctC